MEKKKTEWKVTHTYKHFGDSKLATQIVSWHTEGNERNICLHFKENITHR